MQVENILDFGLVSGEYKMVFVVRNDLKMGKGKVAAQVNVNDSWSIFVACVLSPLYCSIVWSCSHRGLQTDTQNQPRSKCEV